MSVLELWGAEYQENSAVLLKPEHLELFKQICEREKCPAAFLGQVGCGEGEEGIGLELFERICECDQPCGSFWQVSSGEGVGGRMEPRAADRPPRFLFGIPFPASICPPFNMSGPRLVFCFLRVPGFLCLLRCVRSR
jgi:hypothetical protein